MNWSATAPTRGVDHHPVMQLEGVEKRYGGAVALSGASFSIQQGEVHCLCGENGAGKSTLIKIMAGSIRPDAGRLLLDGQPVVLDSPQDGIRVGIGVVYQELELIPGLSIMENISLGCEPRGALGSVSWRNVRRRAQEILALMKVDLDVRRLVSTLTVAQAQLVAIAKVLSARPRILVLDEPTAALSGGDLETLFSLIDRLKADGVAIVYISHRMEEIFRLGDRVTVLRDGRTVASDRVAAVDEDKIIRWMVGRATAQRFPHLPEIPGDQVRLLVRELRTGVLKGISFDLRAGEILGCTGLAGCGHDALARALVGLEPALGGTIRINGHDAGRLSPRKSQRLGLGLVPEDRKGQGLVTSASIADNASYSVLDRNASFGVLRSGRLWQQAQQYKQSLKIRSHSLTQAVSTLSGGNQQKVVLARVLATEPSVLVLDEPTRGIDVGAKAEIYQLIVGLAAQGCAILLISSEMVEVMALSHRLMVLAEGELAATLSAPFSDVEILSKALAPAGTAASRSAGSRVLEHGAA